MPTLETPPELDPAATPPKLTAGRYGALDHSEIVHLLSTLDDEVARSRFRESIYISLIICLALAWLALYGPRVLFHQGRLVAATQQQSPNKLTYLEVPPDLPKSKPPKVPQIIADQSHQAQTPHPVDRQLTPEQLEAMRRAGTPSRPQPQPKPLPATPQPQQQSPQPAPPTPQPQPPRPQPQQPQLSNIPEAPRPSQQAQNQSRPNFSTPSNSRDSISQAERNALSQHGQGGDNGQNAPRSHSGAKGQVEILSDTLGVDFGPYLARLKRNTLIAWEPLLPEETRAPLYKSGETLIRFTIQPNGVVSAMHLDDSTHDRAIDKSAWGSITSQGQLEPLPATFKGPVLELRFHYFVGPAAESAQ